MPCGMFTRQKLSILFVMRFNLYQRHHYYDTCLAFVVSHFISSNLSRICDDDNCVQ